ncbi:hypothetical protein V5799_000337 [Amblyomma americanum]|uniref:Lipocalin n=1 Tax=Amblyomma americanum TaxID=6943 RepID=A0AAQ4D3C1_AMBAM
MLQFPTISTLLEITNEKMLIFLVAVSLQLAAAASENVPTITDLVEALNTSERVWLVIRSYNYAGHEASQHQYYNCVYVEKKSLTKNTYNYTQHFIINGQKETLDFDTTLESGTGDGPVITVGLKSGKMICFSANFVSHFDR